MYRFSQQTTPITRKYTHQNVQQKIEWNKKNLSKNKNRIVIFVSHFVSAIFLNLLFVWFVGMWVGLSCNTLFRSFAFTRASFKCVCVFLCKDFARFSLVIACVWLLHFSLAFPLSYRLSKISYLCVQFVCVCGALYILFLWTLSLALQEAKWKIHHDLIYLLDLSKTTRFVW